MEITQESLSQNEWAIFEKWYRNNRLSLEESEARHNTILILASVRNCGYELTSGNLNSVLQRLLERRTPVYRAPDPSDAPSARALQHQGKQFAAPEQAQLKSDQVSGPSQDLYIGGKLNHARLVKPSAPTPVTHSSDDGRWQAMADSLSANTHSATATLRQIVGANWRDTYEKRLQYLKSLDGGKQ